MNKEEFRFQFGPTIRVNVDWELFKSDDVTLERVTLQLPQDLNRLWTPWFPGGSSHHPSDPAAESLSVLGAASDLTLLGSHEGAVRKCMLDVSADEFEAPAVAFPRGRYLLLDQNHHVLAAAVTRVSVRLHVFAIVAPENRHVLVDIPN